MADIPEEPQAQNQPQPQPTWGSISQSFGNLATQTGLMTDVPAPNEEFQIQLDQLREDVVTLGLKLAKLEKRQDRLERQQASHIGRQDAFEGEQAALIQEVQKLRERISRQSVSSIFCLCFK